MRNATNGVLYVHTLFTGQREREREREGGRERERCRICPELLFVFLKGMTGALATFSYLVQMSDLQGKGSRGHIHTLHFLRNLQIGPNKLEFYITVGRKCLSGTNTLAY